MEYIEDNLAEFENMVIKHLKTRPFYTFRCVSIDGILCYPVIYKYRKIVNFESVHIKCKMKNSLNDNILEYYSLLYKRYKSIRDAILLVKRVVSTYKIVDGDLLSPKNYKMAVLESKIVPYMEEQTCSVCYEKTLDTTICNHYICFHCRETCVRKEKMDCPVCRRTGIINIYNIDNGLINNNEFQCLKEVMEHGRNEGISAADEESETVVNAFIDRIGTRLISYINGEPNFETDHIFPISFLEETQESDNGELTIIE